MASPAHPFQILDFVPSGCCILGEGGRILFWNQTLEAWTNVSAAEAQGRNLFELFPQLAQPRFRDRILAVLDTGAPMVFSSALNPQFFPSSRPTGRPRIQQTVLNRLPPGPEGAMVLVTVSDVTDQFERGEKYRSARAQALEEARVRGESEERLHRILENMPVAVYALDEERRLVFWNREAERISGFTAQEALGRADFFQALLPDPAYRESILEMSDQDGRVFRNWECEFTCRDGSVRTIALSSIDRQIPIPGWPGGWGVGVDITDRQRAEEALREAHKLESLAVLAGGIAHDFNNLFSGVLLNLERALTRPGLDPETVGCLGRTRSELLRASELSRKMLAFSGKGSLALRPLDLNGLVRELQPRVQADLPQGVLLRWRLAEGLPPIEGDAVQLQQVIQSLLANALEALEGGQGTIQVATGLEELGEEALQAAFGGQSLPPGFHVTLEVSDTGCGIPAENLSRIFDPFFSTKFAGRGLSLAVAQGVLRGHGAGCRVQSAVGEGTRFKLFFPAVGEAPSGGKAPGDERAPSAGVILLVDDELVLRESLAEILEEAGYTVATAQDGVEAVEYYAAHPGEIGLVVMDLTMPRMDGREAFQAIRRLDPAARVVLCSGFSEHDAIRQFQGEGLVGFLSKPFRGAQLRELVGRFVQP